MCLCKEKSACKGAPQRETNHYYKWLFSLTFSAQFSLCTTNGKTMSASAVFEDLIGQPLANPYKKALFARESLLEQSLAAYQAVLTPNAPGLWSHDLRAALGFRIATLTNSLAAAGGIRKYAARRVFDGWLQNVANATVIAYSDAPAWLNAALDYTDTLTLRTHTASQSLIEALRQHSVSDEDCVKLAELVATLSYQIRLIVGFQALQA